MAPLDRLVALTEAALEVEPDQPAGAAEPASNDAAARKREQLRKARQANDDDDDYSIFESI